MRNENNTNAQPQLEINLTSTEYDLPNELRVMFTTGLSTVDGTTSDLSTIKDEDRVFDPFVTSHNDTNSDAPLVN